MAPLKALLWGLKTEHSLSSCNAAELPAPLRGHPMTLLHMVACTTQYLQLRPNPPPRPCFLSHHSTYHLPYYVTYLTRLFPIFCRLSSRSQDPQGQKLDLVCSLVPRMVPGTLAVNKYLQNTGMNEWWIKPIRLKLKPELWQGGLTERNSTVGNSESLL